MPIDILMPALSPTMETGTLVRWLKKEGDAITAGDVVAEIETDKATMELEVADDGTLAKILTPEGTEDVPVNALIALMAAPGEDLGQVAESARKGASEKPKEALTSDASAPPDEKVVTDKKTAPQAVSPRKDSGASPGGRVFASPLARRLAQQKKLDISGIKGTGPHGRIILRDVEAAKAQPTSGLQGKEDGGAVRALFEQDSYAEVPHDSMRKTIAQRLVESKRTIPHFYLSVDCDLSELVKLRQAINSQVSNGEDGKPLYKLSVNDFVIKALALALRDVPEANVSWTDSSMLKHKHVDVAVAVSIPNGLITPIVRRADEKSISVISTEMKDLAKRARDRQLKPAEYMGGTTAVSNLGMFGVDSFSAIINPPHATILAIGAGKERAIVKDGAIMAVEMMTATLSTDHRAVDGVLGAQLLAAFQHYVTHPFAMFV